MNKKLKIVFFGTPEFAKYSLAALCEAGFNVAAVVTAPDKPAGRGQKLKESEVKEYALKMGITVLQPANMKDGTFINAMVDIGADINIVVAFRMLPEVIWNMPCLGTINLHASLLPQYRGAAPINRVIMNGEKITGVTTFRLNHEIDTGDIILQKEIEIGVGENAGELHDRMSIIGAETLVETIKMFERGEVKFISQDLQDINALNRAPKIFKSDCLIDFNRNGDEIIDQIKGLSPYPTAYFIMLIDNTEVLVKVFNAKFTPLDDANNVGEIISDKNSFLSILVKNGKIDILELQISGKKRLSTSEFLRGFNMNKDISIK